jgi:diadenosine tetraphosphate (Ap4A) HIT family hydrolase
MKKLKLAAAVLASGLAGFALAGFVFHRAAAQPGGELPPPRNPLKPRELAGILGSAGIKIYGGRAPLVVTETEKTVVVQQALFKRWFHYVLVPKKDIKDVGEFRDEDLPYLLDVHKTARAVIEKERLKNYKLYTNGPGLQTVAYWHFHLVGEKPKPE